MSIYFKRSFIFLCLFISPVLSAAEISVATVPSSGHDFWMQHGLIGGLIFCLFLVVVPRLTLAFVALVTGGLGITVLGLLLWLITPHLLVAIIATTMYWQTNPILVIVAWFVAFGGEATEKVYIRRRF